MIRFGDTANVAQEEKKKDSELVVTLQLRNTRPDDGGELQGPLQQRDDIAGFLIGLASGRRLRRKELEATVSLKRQRADESKLPEITCR